MNEKQPPLEVWSLTGARQASYGIATPSPEWFQTLRESFNEVELAVEYGRRVEKVAELPAEATEEERHDCLVALEGWPETFAAQRDRLALLDALDAEDFAAERQRSDEESPA